MNENNFYFPGDQNKLLFVTIYWIYFGITLLMLTNPILACSRNFKDVKILGSTIAVKKPSFFEIRCCCWKNITIEMFNNKILIPTLLKKLIAQFFCWFLFFSKAFSSAHTIFLEYSLSILSMLKWSGHSQIRKPRNDFAYLLQIWNSFFQMSDKKYHLVLWKLYDNKKSWNYNWRKFSIKAPRIFWEHCRSSGWCFKEKRNADLFWV